MTDSTSNQGSVSEFATEFEIEYVVLTAVDDGVYDREAIQERVRSTVRTLPDDDANEIEAAIDRLIDKQILSRDDDGTVRLRSND